MKTTNNINCGSGDVIVGYIYGELPLTDRLAFEDHLLDCTACTDEFAAIADSRYAVYEWQKLEFEPMETPRFVIPYAEPAVSWLDAIKGLFAIGPRLATAGAFGLLVAALGFAAIMISGVSSEVVSIDAIKVNETFNEPAAPTAGNNPVAVSQPVETDSSPIGVDVKPVLAAVKQTPKVDQKRRQTAVRRNTTPQRNVGNETQAKAPRLNDFEDLSDNSLRLSDLVADIDTRD